MTSATADALACTEIGTFDTVTAKRFELQLQPLALGGKLVRRDIQEAAGHMVYIPSQGSKDGAAKKANELRHLGINDFYVIQDAGDLHWGISLGIFKTEEAARTQLAILNQKGVHSARLGIHNVPTNKVAFQLRNLGGDAKAGVDKIVHGFPNIAAHACEVAVAVDAKPPVRDNKDTVPRDAMP